MIYKSIAYSIAFLISFTLFIHVMSYKKCASSKHSFEEMVQHYTQVHDTALIRIKNDFKIKDRIWDAYLSAFKKIVQNDDLLTQPGHFRKSTEDNLVKIAQQALIEYGLNPEKVVLRLVKKSDVPAQAIQELDDLKRIRHILELNLQWLSEYDIAMQEAIIRHEIVHLLYYDSLEASYVLHMLYQKGYSKKQCDKHPAIIAYRHQRELRADALACGDNSVRIKAFQSYFSCFIPLEDQENPELWRSHPSDKVRYQELAQLLPTSLNGSSSQLA